MGTVPANRLRHFLIVLSAVLCLGWGGSAAAGTVTLLWDAPETDADGGPLTGLAGYVLYWGESSGDYPTNIDVGNATTYTLTGLPEDVPLYFVVTAYDDASPRNESKPSNEVSGVATPEKQPPPPPPDPVPVGSCAEKPGAYVETTLPVKPVRKLLPLYSGVKEPKLKTVPSVLKGGCLVQTRLADRNSTAPDLVTLHLLTDATVYLGYDERHGIPRWLEEHYDATGIRLSLSKANARMRLWGIPVAKGETLTIPGTRYQRAERGELPYTVWIQGEQ